MKDKLLTVQDVAERIRCGNETARKLMLEMPRFNTSPVGSKRPRYCVRESDLERFISKRLEVVVADEPEKPRRTMMTGNYPKLEYRR